MYGLVLITFYLPIPWQRVVESHSKKNCHRENICVQLGIDQISGSGSGKPDIRWFFGSGSGEIFSWRSGSGPVPVKKFLEDPVPVRFRWKCLRKIRFRSGSGENFSGRSGSGENVYRRSGPVPVKIFPEDPVPVKILVSIPRGGLYVMSLLMATGFLTVH